MRHAGKLVTQRQLLQDVWGPRYGDESNYLRVHMAHLRRKLEPDRSHPRYLITEPGMGYRFVGPPPDAASVRHLGRIVRPTVRTQTRCQDGAGGVDGGVGDPLDRAAVGCRSPRRA